MRGPLVSVGEPAELSVHVGGDNRDLVRALTVGTVAGILDFDDDEAALPVERSEPVGRDAHEMLEHDRRARHCCEWRTEIVTDSASGQIPVQPGGHGADRGAPAADALRAGAAGARQERGQNDRLQKFLGDLVRRHSATVEVDDRPLGVSVYRRGAPHSRYRSSIGASSSVNTTPASDPVKRSMLAA